MLTDELKQGPTSQVKDFFIKEANFAQERIGHNDLFQASEMEAQIIDERSARKKTNQ